MPFICIKYWLYSLCCTINPWSLFVSYIIVCTSWFPIPILPLPSHLSLLVITTSLSSICVSVLLYSLLLVFKFHISDNSIFLCLTYFTKCNTFHVHSRFHKWLNFCFLWLKSILLYIFINPFVDGHLGCFHIWLL